jgi:DNA primase
MNELDEIKNRLDIVDVISSYIKLEKAGLITGRVVLFIMKKQLLNGFTWEANLALFWMFKGGDIFEFVKEIEGIEFGDALKILANKAGVELKKYDTNNLQNKSERQKTSEVLVRL